MRRGAARYVAGVFRCTRGVRQLGRHVALRLSLFAHRDIAPSHRGATACGGAFAAAKYPNVEKGAPSTATEPVPALCPGLYRSCTRAVLAKPNTRAPGDLRAIYANVPLRQPSRRVPEARANLVTVPCARTRHVLVAPQKGATTGPKIHGDRRVVSVLSIPTVRLRISFSRPR